MSREHYIEEASLSVAWARALWIAAAGRKRETGPLTITITGFGDDGTVHETPAIRAALNSVLAAAKKQPVDTVARTIFPHSMWNKAQPRPVLFERYERSLPRIKRASPKNRDGLYFERMISGGPPNAQNQLEHAISAYLARRGVRRSALQVATFDPSKDHSTSAQKGFPCLQHVTFAPCHGVLNVNAFYASQYLVERGYGNYLGLCRLGQFVAHELGLPFNRFTCLVGIAKCELSKKKVAAVFDALNQATVAVGT